MQKIAVNVRSDRHRPPRLWALSAVAVLHMGVLYILLHGFPRTPAARIDEIRLTLNKSKPMVPERPVPPPPVIQKPVMAALPPVIRKPPVMTIRPPETAAEVEPPPAATRSQAIAAAAPAPTPQAKEQRPEDYVSQLAARLDAVKIYPMAARAARRQGVVLLGFTLDRSGNVLDWRIVRSSNVKELDDEVVEMLKLAAPFPAFPKSLYQARQEFVVPINFSLQDQRSHG